MENLIKTLGDTHQNIRTVKTGIVNLQSLIQKIKTSVPKEKEDERMLKILSQENGQLKEKANKQKLLSFLDQLTSIEQNLKAISQPITKLDTVGEKIFNSTAENNVQETTGTALLDEEKQYEVRKRGGTVSINKNGILVIHQSDKSKREQGDLYFEISNIIGPASANLNIHKRSGGAYGNSNVIFVEEKRAA